MTVTRLVTFTLEEQRVLQEILDEVKLHAPLYNSLVFEWTIEGYDVWCRTQATVTERESGEIITAHGSWKLRDPRLLLELAREGKRKVAVNLAASTARQALRAAAIHEIDEMLRVSGELRYDPHAPGALQYEVIGRASDEP